MSITLHAVLPDCDVPTALAKVRSALTDNGFGVITEIDMQQTVKTKLGEDIEPFVILGACNPGLAHRAITVETQIAALLPCNVVVRQDRQDPTTSHVEAMNPDLLAKVLDNPELLPIADEVTGKMRAVIAALGGESTEGNR